MERDEAKAILELCRPGNADDAQDPIIAEALSLLEPDAELKAWFDEQQSLDARISESYNSIEPPADLKASILAGMRAHSLRSESQSEGESESNEPTIVADSKPFNRPNQSWWRNPWIGVAAVFALLFFVVAIPRGGQEPQLANNEASIIPSEVPAMIKFLANEIDTIKSQKRSFAKRSDQPATLQAYLASTGTPSPADLPSPVSTTPSIGCFTLDYNGVKMGMICFKEDQVIHLITARKTDCMGDISTEPCIYEIDGQAFKMWVEGDQVYILSVQGSKEKLPEFI